ncbi:MAG: M23 family metallopeptidase [Flavobacteriaceae bacterium]|jgi:murein DD-endopeptidase MepM/ murein hydrolase activator NlpD|nr:M23 family metallopeptidase [Flavobacteriaceae bacterium]MCI5087487.1 M23 family metallopeptidase [Flavobacteriaceae bacterium]
MAKKADKKKGSGNKWRYKYRLVVLNEDTFEEKVSFKLSRMNVFVVGTLSAMALIALTILLVAFTSLREYIPGYASTDLRRQAVELLEVTDSLSRVIDYNDRYVERIRGVLSGQYAPSEIEIDSIDLPFVLDTTTIELSPIREDSLLRAQVALEDRYNLFENNKAAFETALFSPLSGMITQAFDPEIKHYAIDITAVQDAPVKSIAAGTVVFSEWTSDTGYVIMVQHKNGMLSVYKHNGSLLKNQGDAVLAGEVIAAVGDTGEFSTGPHLHFELWENDRPVNPLNYIDFN